MKVIGIDVGLSGGIGFWNGKEMSVLPMPVYILDPKGKSKKKDYDTHEIKNLISNFKPDIVLIEEQHAFPQQGVVSMFSLGKGYGFLKGLLTGLGIKYVTVKPQEWQKSFKITGGETKIKSFNVSSNLFPHIHFVSKRNKILDGLCDSVLITEYGRINFTK